MGILPAGSPTSSAVLPALVVLRELGQVRTELRSTCRTYQALTYEQGTCEGTGRVPPLVAGWLALIDDCCVGELRGLDLSREIKQAELKAPVAARSARLFYYLQQSLQRF